MDQLPALFIDAPDVTARATIVVSPSAIAQRRQKPHQIAVARWTRRHRHHGRTLDTLRIEARDPALMLRTNTSASVFDDEEKRARATTQVHKVAREGYRSDAGGSAFWAGCDCTTTLVAGARHVRTSSLSARNVPTEPQRFAPSCGSSGPVATAEVVASDPFGLLAGCRHARPRKRSSLSSLSEAPRIGPSSAGD